MGHAREGESELLHVGDGVRGMHRWLSPFASSGGGRSDTTLREMGFVACTGGSLPSRLVVVVEVTQP
jgi:hypothetical protein